MCEANESKRQRIEELEAERDVANHQIVRLEAQVESLVKADLQRRINAMPLPEVPDDEQA